MRRLAYRIVSRGGWLEVTRIIRVPVSPGDDPLDGFVRVDGERLARLRRKPSTPRFIGSPADADLPGRHLFAVVNDEKVSAYLWLWDGPVPPEANYSRHPRLGVGLTPADGGAFVTNLWTAPERRGEGLAGRLLQAAGRHRQCRWLDASIDWTNDASLRTFRKLGGTSIATVTRTRRPFGSIRVRWEADLPNRPTITR